MKAIDVWAQHPTKRVLAEPFFDPLKQWTGQNIQAIPLEFTAHAMQSAGVEKALLSAWYGPTGSLISNEEVLGFVNRYPGLFAGIASADLRNPVEAVKTLRRFVTEHGFKGPMLTPEACLNELSVLGLDEEVSDLFLRWNAKAVFSL